MIRAWCVGAMLACATAASAQTTSRTLSLDEAIAIAVERNRTLANATLAAEDADHDVASARTRLLTAEPSLQVTDETGAFGFGEVGPGPYTVTLSLDGFEEQKLNAVVVPTSSPLRVVLQIAGLAETVVVRAATPETTPQLPAGESTLQSNVLVAVPLATERFEDALPLLPGTLRGPDGLLSMKGGRADQGTVRSTTNGNLNDLVSLFGDVRDPATPLLCVSPDRLAVRQGARAGGVRRGDGVSDHVPLVAALDVPRAGGLQSAY